MIRVRDYILAGMPSSPRGTNGPFRCIAAHTTEGNPGVAGAEATARWMASTASTRNASYHELWAWEGGDLHVLRLVAASRAAHSIGPGTTYEPDAWVRSCLGDKVADPNMWVYAVSIAGRTSVEGVSYAQDDNFLYHARERLNALGIPRLAEHFRFNPSTRSDWGRNLSTALGGLTLPYEANVADIDTFLLETIRIDSGANIRSAPSDGASVLFQTGAISSAVSVGTKNGYHGYWIDSRKAWGYTHTASNVISREPYGTVIGVPQSKYDLLLADYNAVKEQGAKAMDLRSTQLTADAKALRAKQPS